MSDLDYSNGACPTQCGTVVGSKSLLCQVAAAPRLLTRYNHQELTPTAGIWRPTIRDQIRPFPPQ